MRFFRMDRILLWRDRIERDRLIRDSQSRARDVTNAEDNLDLSRV